MDRKRFLPACGLSFHSRTEESSKHKAGLRGALPIAKGSPAFSEWSPEVPSGPTGSPATSHLHHHPSLPPHWSPGCSLNIPDLLPPQDPLPGILLSQTSLEFLVASSEGPSCTSMTRGPAPLPYSMLLGYPHHHLTFRFFFFFLAAPRGLWDLSSPTSNRT